MVSRALPVQQGVLSTQLEVHLRRELELRHLTRFGLGLCLLVITLVFMPFIQEALNTLETAKEQVEALDSNWNTVSLGPGDHFAENQKAGQGDIISVQFLVTVPLVVDRDGSIDFYIFDQANYNRRYRDGQAAEALREEQDLGSGTFSVSVPKADRYYVVFDNGDDMFFEPDEEVKYRLVIYTTIQTQAENPRVTAVLLLPSLLLMAAGGYGWWTMRGARYLRGLPIRVPAPPITGPEAEVEEDIQPNPNSK